MSFWSTTLLGRLRLFVGIVLLLSSQADARNNLTGHYEAPPRQGCDESNFIPDLGPAYLNYCFTGNAYGYSPVLQLVQNGQLICGTYFECGGRNCNKVYSGAIAGSVKKNELQVYWANGHFQDGLALQLNFRAVRGGLVESNNKSSQPTLVKRSSKLKGLNLVKLCKPELSQTVLVNSDFELDLENVLKPEQIEFVNLAQKKYALPPQPKILTISNQSKKIGWIDERITDNYVIRSIQIFNKSNYSWVIEYEHPEACQEFLRSSDHGRKNKAANLLESGREILPGDIVQIASCNGSRWSLEQSLPACPKFQCLESCKC